METTAPTRRLAAILMADVAGYSRMMGENEEATVASVHECREVFGVRIPEFRGRLVDATGDALMAEFGSMTDALSCAVQVQRHLAERNAAQPAERRMSFRIGINLGEVLVRGEEIYGDDVNIAARLESLAEPGGICISRSAYDRVVGRVEIEYEYIGPQVVKNIPEPVRAYRVLLAGAAAPSEGENAAPAPSTASPAEPATSLPQLPAAMKERPSIAVLPFANMSGDPEQEYFADGITEDLITGLSRLRNMFVIARNSVFTYKGKPADVREVGRDLGVRHVLEGSVRKSGNRVRITAQLIDCSNGDHLWAERYDREMKDIFDLQDEITRDIVTELEVKLVEGEEARLRRSSTHDPEAYDAMLRGMGPFNEFSKQSLAAARPWFHKSLELDPEFGTAWAWLGWTHLHDFLAGWGEDPVVSLGLAEQAAERALAADPEYGGAHTLRGGVLFSRGEHGPAIAALEKGVALTPNDSVCMALLGMYLSIAGQADKGMPLVEQALALNPHPPAWFYQALGYAHLFSGRLGEAIASLRQCMGQIPEYMAARAGLVAALLLDGQEAEAEAQAREMLRISPKYNLRRYVTRLCRNAPDAFERIAAKIGIE